MKRPTVVYFISGKGEKQSGKIKEKCLSVMLIKRLEITEWL